MSCKELIHSLRTAADERVRLLWQEAEKKAADLRAETARKLVQLRNDLEKSRIASVHEQSSAAVAEAQNKARLLRLSAEQELSRRLYQIAAGSLPALRGSNYEQIFTHMAEELPALDWKSVTVNPADAALARARFPRAAIIPDGNISGGLDVSTADGSIRIINTFEKRLERAWREMLPGLLKDARREVTDGTPAVSPEPGISGRVSFVPD